MPTVPVEAEVRIEVPRGSLAKWRSDGTIDFLSPVPCPFNYGSVPDTLGADGDPVDAVVLGPVLPRGKVARWPVWGAVHFVDGGVSDDKLICADREPTARQWRQIRRFFALYAVAKRILNRVRGVDGWTGVRPPEARA